MTRNLPGAVATDDTAPPEPSPAELAWPGIERHLDGVTMCRSVSLYALRGWFDTAVDLAAARADGHGWDHDQAVNHAVERLRKSLHATVDTLADLKLTVGAGGRIQ